MTALLSILSMLFTYLMLVVGVTLLAKVLKVPHVSVFILSLFLTPLIGLMIITEKYHDDSYLAQYQDIPTSVLCASYVKLLLEAKKKGIELDRTHRNKLKALENSTFNNLMSRTEVIVNLHNLKHVVLCHS